jgi:hypothetical protein
MRNVAFAVVAASTALSCAGRAPSPNDPELKQGIVQALPLPEPFPRVGLQWTYEVIHGGWPKDAEFVGQVAYRLTDRNAFRHPWGGWWIHKGQEFCAGTGATFNESGSDGIFWHPPRMISFKELQWAPWPIAKPGKPGTTESVLTMGEGWEVVGEKVHKKMVDVGLEPIEVPAGRFEKAWRVDGETKAWKGSFWWVASVGFVLMDWSAADGRKLTLRLLHVKLIEQP